MQKNHLPQRKLKCFPLIYVKLCTNQFADTSGTYWNYRPIYKGEVRKTAHTNCFIIYFCAVFVTNFFIIADCCRYYSNIFVLFHCPIECTVHSHTLSNNRTTKKIQKSVDLPQKLCGGPFYFLLPSVCSDRSERMKIKTHNEKKNESKTASTSEKTKTEQKRKKKFEW